MSGRLGRCGADVEVEQAGAIVIRRHAQVASIAKVSANLDGVVALDKGPVVDDLELILFFNKRAVATVDVRDHRRRQCRLFRRRR